MTAVESEYLYDRIVKMANPDQLSTIAQLIPYIQHRQAIAADYLKANNEHKAKVILDINEKIKTILSII